MAILTQRFDQVEFLDFASVPLTNADFKDPGHLNYLGAQKFSEWFQILIKRGLFEVDDKQEFIKENLSLIEKTGS